MLASKVIRPELEPESIGRANALLAAMRPVVVVPCYNEANRLDAEGFRAFLDTPGLNLLFVDDGSTDDTQAVLTEMASSTLEDRARVVRLANNCGKAEAVRRGMLRALEDGAELVGYFDADLATPPEEMARLLRLLASGNAQAVLASRVALLGTDIGRHAYRHYCGRVFATAASLILDLRVYDTQCGAKAFRRSAQLLDALSVPFTGRWAFDVELLGRLLARRDLGGITANDLIEMPLKKWTDIGGSRLTLKDWPLIAAELARIRLALARWREERTPAPLATAMR